VVLDDRRSKEEDLLLPSIGVCGGIVKEEEVELVEEDESFDGIDKEEEGKVGCVTFLGDNDGVSDCQTSS
jgi:hypothetical protein